MKPADRRAGYWNRERETMSAGARERYQAGWLGALLEHAWRHAPGVRRRLDEPLARAAARLARTLGLAVG